MDIFKFLRHEKAQITNRQGSFMAGGSIPPDYNSIEPLQDYGQIGWLFAVNYRIGLGCSEVNWYLEDITNKDKPKRIDEHDILTVLRQVNPFQTKEEFIALHFIYKGLIGKSFWVLNFNRGGEPSEIVLAYPHKMWIVADRAFPFIKGYIYGDTPNSPDAIPLDKNEVIYDKDPNPLNQYSGIGAAQAIGVDLQSQKYAGKWNRNFFFNSARTDAVIQFEYNLSDEQFNKLKKQWREQHQGVDKAHQVALLEGGGKYVQIINTVKDMDFSNLSQNIRDSILGVYGMPQSVLGISKDVNKAVAEAGDYTYSRHLIKPRLSWLCSKLNEQLLPKFKSAKNLVLKFDEIVPQTTEEKKGLADAGIKGGILTIDEARKLRGEDPIGGKVGDCLIIPLNNVLINKDGEVVFQPVQPNPFGGSPTLPEENNLEETEEEAPKKSYTSEQKKEIWNKYALKTSKQEEEFKQVFSKTFSEQKDEIVKEFELRGKLPDSLDDEKTAKKFEPSIKETYLSGFKDAI